AKVAPGAIYKYRIEGKDAFPDPASRYQPLGVHGPSQVIDFSKFAWKSPNWKGIPLEKLAIFELHVGTFSSEGTFRGVENHLPYLADLGVNAIELMPVADFPGRHNWGYDGVSINAPARCHGRPEDLVQLVDTAHSLGLAVFLDVVYNHFGPDGNYLGIYTPYFESKKNTSPWGAAINFDGEHSDMVRRYFIDSALYWLNAYCLDGLRLDATHAIIDHGKPHFLAELSTKVHATITDRKVHLIAEDHRNLAHMVKPVSAGGWGLDGIWADDFHHQVRRLLAGDSEGYFRDFTGSTQDLATNIQQGWFFTGQHSIHLNEPRGTDPTGLNPRAFVICLQNHDQIGNRAFGERLHHQIELCAYRAASALLLLAPQTPLLFMGQEWAASTPFRFFTDFDEQLGNLVTAGRRQEFRHFSAFTDPKVRESIPDPQAEATFQQSILDWSEKDHQPHLGMHELYRTLLHLRQTEPALQCSEVDSFRCLAPTEHSIILERTSPSGDRLLLVCQLVGSGKLDSNENPVLSAFLDTAWNCLFTTEDLRFTQDGHPPSIQQSSENLCIDFPCPCAVLLKER
ncbi:MAG: malto-oligosyltrehalose trehalohydrolase, partial [Bdellovibrionales bacterium]